jgi:hypothetical protein
MSSHPIGPQLTRLGALAAHPAAFGVVARCGRVAQANDRPPLSGPVGMLVQGLSFSHG